MNKNKIIISILTILALITSLVFFLFNKNEKQIEASNEYKNIAILVNGVRSSNIPTDKYYYMSAVCSGMKLDWNVLEKKLKIKGIETTIENPSCTVNFEEVNVDIKVDEVVNYNPTGNLIIIEKNCGDAEIIYNNNKLNIKFNSKPTSCIINLGIKSVKNTILSENNEQSDEFIDFTKISSDTNGKGLYYTSNLNYGEDNTKIYYFRGRVENNWVSFGGFLWRIVRTTSEGGTRLIYSGDGSQNASGFITNSVFNSNNNLKYYTGYTYNTNGYTGTQTNSLIKSAVDGWYNANLIAYANYLSTTAVYCADRSSERIDGSNYIYFPSNDRIHINQKPSFNCNFSNASRYTVNTNTGNGYLQYPIGLLNVDEISYSGLIRGNSAANKNNFFIYDNATSLNWWTMSPSNFTSPYGRVGIVINGYISMITMSTTGFGVRPVVSLKPCVIVTGGNGSKSTPYLLTNNECT